MAEGVRDGKIVSLDLGAPVIRNIVNHSTPVIRLMVQEKKDRA